MYWLNQSTHFRELFRWQRLTILHLVNFSVFAISSAVELRWQTQIVIAPSRQLCVECPVLPKFTLVWMLCHSQFRVFLFLSPIFKYAEWNLSSLFREGKHRSVAIGAAMDVLEMPWNESRRIWEIHPCCSIPSATWCDGPIYQLCNGRQMRWAWYLQDGRWSGFKMMQATAED